MDTTFEMSLVKENFTANFAIAANTDMPEGITFKNIPIMIYAKII